MQRQRNPSPFSRRLELGETLLGLLLVQGSAQGPAVLGEVLGTGRLWQGPVGFAAKGDGHKWERKSTLSVYHCKVRQGKKWF